MFVQWSRVCVLAALVSLFASSAMAQSAPEARSGGAFDFYVLTLSWSPAFCESGGGREYRAQCEPGLGKGFVTHGLWPQYEHGFPSECDGAATPSRMALEHVAGVYPDEGLARHEWRKHGRCSGKSPTDYFLDVRRATESVTIPPPLERPRQAQSFAPLDIQRAFIAANPRLRPGMLAVTCRKGALQDVRICFSRDLREFRPCPEIARGACRAGEISVPAPL
ncbi:ribonuclease T [Methylosinus sporium]|uniref:ribonuclease T2 family protein n=1 Tax=Methylosinus sporium TaxID=428 RepID=UPI00383B1DC1